MTQTEPKALPAVPWPEFVALFDPSVHRVLRDKILEPGVEGLFMMECHDAWSSQYAARAACVYGPEKTFKAEDLKEGLVTGGTSVERKTLVCRVVRSECEAAVAAGWKPPEKKRTPRPEITKFGQMEVGDEFDFVGPDPVAVSFSKKCWKIGRHHYRDEDGDTHRVGSVSARVYHVVRESYE